MQRAARVVFALLAFVPLGASRASAAGVLPATPMLPPMIVTVATASDVPASLVTMMLEETDAIWRRAGFTFIWQRVSLDAAPLDASPRPVSLRVVVGRNQRPSGDGRMPLGWIVFDDVSTPEQEVYVSYTSAERFLATAGSAVGPVHSMPRLQRETLMARSMGRVLAHEIGHYLLASKVHTVQGLMKAVQTAVELFSPDRSRFIVEPSQMTAVALRVASLQPALPGVTSRLRSGA
jgi:hypothetical protein